MPQKARRMEERMEPMNKDMNQNSNAAQEGNRAGTAQDRQKLLKSYVERLSSGENLDEVRKDFVENFSDVDAAEIMRAEQTLMKEGTSYRDVQKLCDVHSALFHGATREEKIANAEKAVQASLDADAADVKAKVAVSTAVEHQAPGMGRNMRDVAKSQLQKLAQIPGHPISVFMKEDDAIEAELGRVKALLDDSAASLEDQKREFGKLRAIGLHYAAKGDLLYPLLKSKHDISGPADVMWGVDDEIRAEIRNLTGGTGSILTAEQWRARAAKLVTRAQEMIFKERNILFPICIQNFGRNEWIQMALDLQDYEPCMIEKQPLWKLAENARAWQNSSEAASSASAAGTDGAAVPQASAGTSAGSGAGKSDLEKAAEALIRAAMASAGSAGTAGAASGNAEIVFPSGHMTKEQITAMLDTIPGEITFVDADDINRYFNRGEGPKAFKRPLEALDREVYYCHPPKVEEMVRMIISSFKEGKRDSVDVWMDKNGHTYLVRYMAVRDKQGKFVGSLEYVQNMDAAKEHFLGKKPKED